MGVIEISHVSKLFSPKEGEVHALKDVSVSIEAGDIYGIIGMSGAGKSTLVRCMNYLERPTVGSVKVFNQELGALSEKELRKMRQDIGMIFQHFNLLMQKNVLENVCYPLYIQGVKRKEARAKAMELLELVGLADRAKTYPAKLSGGQQQRVAIARALASNPKILLCDEATSALDPQTTASILELLKEINEKFGITIVIITHQMAVVREICNRVTILSSGVVVEEGEVAEVFKHPKSPEAKELIRRDLSGEVDAPVHRPVSQVREGKTFRIVFTENSSYEPVISNVIMQFMEPVNILGANTRNVSGIARGEMLLQLIPDSKHEADIVAYLEERGIAVEEVNADELE